MPENLKTLRRRIRSVQSTRKITRTMEMIAAAKLRRVQGAMESARPYARKIRELVGHLAHSETAGAQSFFERREGDRLTLVVIASDRGLCGGYNTNVLRGAEGFIAENGGRDKVDVCAVGRRAALHFRKREVEVVDAMTDWGGNVEIERAQELSDTLVRRFLTRETDRVVFYYNAYLSVASYEPTALSFLPLTPEEFGEEASGVRSDGVFETRTEYLFEPDAARVFDALLPRYARTLVYSVLLEAMTSEHNARRLAMSNASENCAELIDSLTLRANKARQAAITTEILEIVAGAEALKG